MNNRTMAIIYVDQDSISVKTRSRKDCSPQRWFKNCFIGSLALGVEGRNLWLMKSNVPHIDPETNIFGPSAVGSGVEYSAIPTTRSWGFNIKLTF